MNAKAILAFEKHREKSMRALQSRASNYKTLMSSQSKASMKRGVRRKEGTVDD